MSNIVSWVMHAFTGCPDAAADHVRYGITYCPVCGRIKFIGDSLPRIARFKRPKRRVKL